MGRLGRIAAEGLMERRRPAPRVARRSPTIADRDRAILELWDLNWSVASIAGELAIAEHLVAQAIELFEGGVQ